MTQVSEESSYSKVLSQKLSTIYQELCQYNNTEHATFLDYDDLKIVGVRSGLKSKLDFSKFRSELLSMLHREDESPIVQIVGDSGTSFSEIGINRSLKVLSSHLKSTCVVEYGFTASFGDANWVVNHYVSENRELSSQTVGLLVGQSIRVLSQDDWQATENVKNLVILCNDDSTLTKFGDDIWISDKIMSKSFGDMLICFEGGVQSFRQAVNVLCEGVPVMTCTGLRDTNGRFSAAALLQALVCSNISDIDDAKRAFDEYILHAAPKTDVQKLSIWHEVERLVTSVGTDLDKLVRLC